MAQAELGLIYKMSSTPDHPHPDDKYRVVVSVDETTQPPTFSTSAFTAPDGSQPFDIQQARLSYMVGGGHPYEDIGQTFGTITLQETQEALSRFIDQDAPKLKSIENDLKQDFANEWVHRR